MIAALARKLRSSRVVATLIALFLLLHASPAMAQNAETVEGLGPDDGHWELEYVGQFGDANGSVDRRQHSGQSFYAISPGLAIGGETQLSYRSGPLVNDRLYFDYDSAIAIVRFAHAEEDPVGLGLWLQAGLDASDGEIARLEGRVIAEKKTPRWWAEGNLMLRRVNEREQEGGVIAYSARLRHALEPDTWLGIEASGQALELGGFNRKPLDRGQFLGPSFAREIALRGDAQLQLGITYLRRLDDHQGLRNLLQIVAGLRF